ncbi:MAG: type I-E CRISPR-associated protein Cse1/CasA [Oscillospiraceae bacterium]|nr:type I-E CRISPR-associated protein Cse1/CasA [Oscillospiraceae bacterium]
MEQEFNLIDEPWICVRTANCQIKEVSLKEVMLHAHEYIELSGETKSQDFAILRLLLAIMYTVFSRYDIYGDEISIDELEENSEFAVDNWEEIWNSGQIPSEPIERYFREWHERFWLFHEQYPFYQSNAVIDKAKKEKGKKYKEKMYKTAKMIGTLFESHNKKRLFVPRMEQGQTLSYSEAARWLLHSNCFDDIAAKNPTPKRTWVGKLAMIALKGKNLFETIMLNYCADADNGENEIKSTPSWEQENPVTEFNRLISVPKNQAGLLSLMSRRIYLCRENHSVIGYFISGGDYFKDDEVFSEQMTLWQYYEEKESGKSKFKPKPYHTKNDEWEGNIKIWQEFGSIAPLAKVDENCGVDEKFRKAGIIDWICKLLNSENDILDKENYFVKVDAMAVIYDEAHAASLQVIDIVSDTLILHAKLLLDIGYNWRNRIISEIDTCEKVANQVYFLHKNLQKSNGKKYTDEEDGKKNKNNLNLEEGNIKVQFYAAIDYRFRMWLLGINLSSEEIVSKPDTYVLKWRNELKKIAYNFGDDLTAQSGSNAIFGHYRKPNRSEKESGKSKRKSNRDEKDEEEITSSAQALNIFRSKIKKIFESAGEKNEQE